MIDFTRVRDEMQTVLLQMKKEVKEETKKEIEGKIKALETIYQTEIIHALEWTWKALEALAISYLDEDCLGSDWDNDDAQDYWNGLVATSRSGHMRRAAEAIGISWDLLREMLRKYPEALEYREKEGDVG